MVKLLVEGVKRGFQHLYCNVEGVAIVVSDVSLFPKSTVNN